LRLICSWSWTILTILSFCFNSDWILRTLSTNLFLIEIIASWAGKI
jgi:hypothetical protein